MPGITSGSLWTTMRLSAIHRPTFARTLPAAWPVVSSLTGRMISLTKSTWLLDHQHGQHPTLPCTRQSDDTTVIVENIHRTEYPNPHRHPVSKTDVLPHSAPPPTRSAPVGRESRKM